jgi:hypothetical protein
MLVGVMMTDQTAGCRPKKSVVTDEMSGRAADQGTLYAASGLRLTGGKNGDPNKQCTGNCQRLHFSSPCASSKRREIGSDLFPEEETSDGSNLRHALAPPPASGERPIRWSSE